MNHDQQLRKRIEQQVRRMKRADAERPTLLAQTIYLGTLGLLLVLPVVVGAYLGHWLDERTGGYSTSWTLSLIVLGVVIGAVNVYLLIRD
jgi:ATP synthase protein I